MVSTMEIISDPKNRTLSIEWIRACKVYLPFSILAVLKHHEAYRQRLLFHIFQRICILLGQTLYFFLVEFFSGYLKENGHVFSHMIPEKVAHMSNHESIGIMLRHYPWKFWSILFVKVYLLWDLKSRPYPLKFIIFSAERTPRPQTSWVMLLGMPAVCST